MIPHLAVRQREKPVTRGLATTGRLYEHLMAATDICRDRVKTGLLRDVFGKRGHYPSPLESVFRESFPREWAFIRTFNRNDHAALLCKLQNVESDLVIMRVGQRLQELGCTRCISLHDAVFCGSKRPWQCSAGILRSVHVDEHSAETRREVVIADHPRWNRDRPFREDVSQNAGPLTDKWPHAQIEQPRYWRNHCCRDPSVSYQPIMSLRATLNVVADIEAVEPGTQLFHFPYQHFSRGIPAEVTVDASLDGVGGTGFDGWNGQCVDDVVFSVAAPAVVGIARDLFPVFAQGNPINRDPVFAFLVKHDDFVADSVP